MCVWHILGIFKRLFGNPGKSLDERVLSVYTVHITISACFGIVGFISLAIGYLEYIGVTSLLPVPSLSHHLIALNKSNNVTKDLKHNESK